jgi:cyclomaltodextrinase
MTISTLRISYFVFLILFVSCSNNKQAEVKQVQHSDLILGLGSPVTLPVSSPASINLNDYVLDASKLDSVSVETPITITLGEDLMANLNWDKPLPPLVEMQLWSGGIPSTIMLRRSQKQELKLNYSGEAESVHIAGEFTGWSAKGQDFEKVDGAWTKTIFLDPGMYQYQLVIDGTWILDPSNPDSVDNNVGGMNSLLNVGGLEQEGRSILRADSYSEGKIDVLYQSAPLQVYALWENHRLPYEAVQFVGEEISISIPEAAINKDYSTLRVWSYNNQGVSNDLHIPLKNGVPVLNKADVPRQDWHSAQLYFMMVDRFINGDTLNDDPLVDPDVHYKANYQGGDLTGIHQTLDKGYFEDLSMNTVWVSPITQNPLIGYVEFPAPHRKFSGYHGYWPILNTKVDHRLGTEQELRNLIDASHAKDMNIILDFVSNHVHEDHPSVKEHPEWKTQLDLPDGRKNIRIWEDQRLTTWFDTFLPSLDHSIPEVTEMLSDTALFWVKDFGFDGFRHDATKHIPQDFWRTLTRKIKEEVIVEKGQSVFQIGETFGSRELIGSYIGSGMMDGKFDFNLYFDARNVFAMDSEDFDRLGTSLQASLSYYGNHHLMGNITGNHDLPRFISYAGEGLKFGEDEKEAGWNRDIKVENPVGYDKLGQLIAFMWTIPGIPVMYYGDEFGMPGAGDPDNRRLMRFDLSEDESAMLETTKTITGLRADHLALQFGDIYDINAEGKSMSFKRKYFEDEVIVVFNKNSSQQMISVSDETGEWKNHFGSKMHFEDGNLEIHVPAYGFEILTKN